MLKECKARNQLLSLRQSRKASGEIHPKAYLMEKEWKDQKKSLKKSRENRVKQINAKRNYYRIQDDGRSLVEKNSCNDD